MTAMSVYLAIIAEHCLEQFPFDVIYVISECSKNNIVCACILSPCGFDLTVLGISIRFFLLHSENVYSFLSLVLPNKGQCFFCFNVLEKSTFG